MNYNSPITIKAHIPKPKEEFSFTKRIPSMKAFKTNWNPLSKKTSWLFQSWRYMPERGTLDLTLRTNPSVQIRYSVDAFQYQIILDKLTNSSYCFDAIYRLLISKCKRVK